MAKKINKTQKRIGKKGAHVVFDKYDLYHRAVQSAETDVQFIKKTYFDLKKKKANLLREDFCGTHALSCEWVKLDPKHVAFGVDLDPEPIEYGKSHYWKELKPDQQKRVRISEANVMSPDLAKVDITIAMNFSYFIFKQRDVLKKYFQNVYKNLNKDGIFLVDIFGGTQCQGAIEDTNKHKDFTYFWDQTGFDPVSAEAVFHIHFKVGGQKIEKVFTYDWRMWTIPEIREIMHEVGFKKTNVYWEGTTKDGKGDGVFSRTEKGEECLSWIAYVVGEK